MIDRPRGGALLLGIVLAVVAAAVGTAILVLDSPAVERQRRLDERRIEDLRALAGAIDSYWTREAGLPAALDELIGWQGIDAPRTDPASGEPYRYRTLAEPRYELCADFAAAAPGRAPEWVRQGHRMFWHHPAGDHCFALEAETVER